MKNLQEFRNLEPQPRLSVVGAGPGDPELITLKAIKSIASAQVILYDALVDTELLSHAKESAEKYSWAKSPAKAIPKMRSIF